MATIQIRELPEETYEVIRRRARAEHQSIQAYMRQQLIDMAATPTKAEASEAIEASLAAHGEADITAAEIIRHRDADRR